MVSLIVRLRARSYPIIRNSGMRLCSSHDLDRVLGLVVLEIMLCPYNLALFIFQDSQSRLFHEHLTVIIRFYFSFMTLG